MEKLITYLLNGVEIPAGTPGAVAYETAPIAPETGLYNGGMTKGSAAYRTALFVDGGKVSAEQSVPAAITGGTYDDAKAEGGKIDSDNTHFNGVMVNDSSYTVKDLTMTADGSGGNDFKGFGAGVAVYGKSNVAVDGFVYDAAGQLRHGVFAGGTKAEDKLTIKVENSFVRSNGSKYEAKTEGMSSCPWMLGISPDGHARATMIDGYADVTYEKDILLSDGWGVLSIDDTGDTTEFGAYSIDLKVKDSVVDVTTDGSADPSCYATYSIGGCFNKFYGCTVGNAAESEKYQTLKAALKDTGVSYDYATKKYGMTYAAVIANEHASAGWYDGCDVTTKYGVMYHKTNNVRYVPGGDDTSATLPACGITEVKDSTFNNQGAAFLIKACTPVIDVKNSKFNSEKGVIVQLMTCDDPGMGTPAFSEKLDTSAPLEKDPGYDPYGYNVKNQQLFRKFNVKSMINDPQVSFTDCNAANGTALKGDFYNSISVATNGEGMIWWGQNLNLSFDNCDVEGACSSSVALHDNYSFYTAPAANEFGAIAVNKDGYEVAGKWEAPKNKMPPMPMPGEEMPGMPPMGDMGDKPPMEMPPMAAPKFYFTPEKDAQGNLIVIGTEQHKPTDGWIYSADATMLGGLTNTAAPTVNNGVWVALKNGSTWTPVGTSYLTRLEVSADSKVNGTVTLDGAQIAVEAGKVYTGAIVVTA